MADWNVVIPRSTLDELARLRLSTTERMVFVAIRAHADSRGNGAWPSMETIAEIAGCSIRAARRAIGVMCGKRIIVTIKRNGRPNGYEIKGLFGNPGHTVTPATQSAPPRPYSPPTPATQSGAPATQSADQDPRSGSHDQREEAREKTAPPSLSASPPEKPRMPPKTHLPDSRPIGDEHAEVLELQALHAKTWGIDHPEVKPRGDTMGRILEALRTFGLDKCRAAVLGHHRQASKPDSRLNRDLRSVFPALKVGNRQDDRKLDTDRVQGYIQDAPRLNPGSNGKPAKRDYLTREDVLEIASRTDRTDKEEKILQHNMQLYPRWFETEKPVPRSNNGNGRSEDVPF